MKEDRIDYLIKESIDYVLLEKLHNEWKEQFRKLHKKASNLNEDVMNKYYNISSNGNKPVRLDEITINRVIGKHGDNGAIGISAWRSDMPQDRNEEMTRNLIQDINHFGYSYLPVYGGYKGSDNIQDIYEPSFIVFNYLTNGEVGDFEALRQFGIDMCKKYNQDSVLIKAPNEAPIYVGKDGLKANSSESNKVFKNDLIQPYFTSLKSKEDVDNEINQKMMGMYKSYCRRNNVTPTKQGYERFYTEHLKDVKSIGKRYTYDIRFDECYVNPMPCHLTERMKRSHEIMIWE